MLVPVAVALLAGLASAATTTSSFCAQAKSCPSSATGFCSSYLKIPAKTTTVAPTVTKTQTTTVVTGVTTTTAITGTSTYTTTSVSAKHVSSTKTVTLTSTYTSTSCTYSYSTAGCTFTGTSPPAPQKRAPTSTTPRPSCLSSYASGTALSSGCQCLSIPTSTSTVTTGSTVTKTAVQTVTKPQSTKTANTVVTKTTTKVSTSTSTLFFTSTIQPTKTIYRPAQATSYFLRNGPSGNFSFITEQPDDRGNGLRFSLPSSARADQFYLANREGSDCVLSGPGGGGYYAFVVIGGDDTVMWALGEIPEDYRLRCLMNSYTNELFCRNAVTSSYIRGYVDAAGYWHIPVGESPETARIVAAPVGGLTC